MPRTSNMRNTLGPNWMPAPISLSSLACSSTCTGNPARVRLSAADRPPMPAPTMRTGRSAMEAFSQEVAERFEKALEVVHRDHVACVRHHADRHRGCDAPHLVDRFPGKRTFACHDEQRLRLDLRQIRMDVVGLEAAMGLRDGGLVAGRQPFRPQPQM